MRVVTVGHGVTMTDAVAAIADSDIEIIAAVESARAALGAVIAHRPDAVVIAAVLPEMTGEQLAATLRYNDPRIRAVVLPQS